MPLQLPSIREHHEVLGPKHAIHKKYAMNCFTVASSTLSDVHSTFYKGNRQLAFQQCPPTPALLALPIQNLRDCCIDLCLRVWRCVFPLKPPRNPRCTKTGPTGVNRPECMPMWSSTCTALVMYLPRIVHTLWTPIEAPWFLLSCMYLQRHICKGLWSKPRLALRTVAAHSTSECLISR